MPVNTVSPTIEVTVPAIATVIEASSYTYDGATATFSGDVAYQISADGSPVVVSDRTITLVSGAPSLSQIAPDGITYISQGAMLAPLAKIDVQGWDEYIERFSFKAAVPYGNNVNPGATNQSVVFTSGSHGCYIQSLWRGFNDKYSIAKYIPLVTVVPEPLEAGEFRPGVANGGAARTNYGANANNIDLSVLRNSVAKPGICRGLTEIVGQLAQDRLRPLWDSTNDETQRRLETCVHGDYGQDYGAEVAYDILALHFTADNAAKMPKVLNIIQNAIDRRSVLDQGYRYGIGAGQNANGWVELVYAGFFLNDPSFLEAALQVKTNTTGQNVAPYPAELLGRNHPVFADTGSSNDSILQPGFLEHEWAWISGYWRPNTSIINGGGYFYGNDGMTIMEVLAIALLQNGPAGMTGVDWLNSVGFGHLITIMDDRDVMVPQNNGSIRYFAPLRAAYDALRSSLGAAPSGRPLQLSASTNTAVAGGFSTNFTGYQFSRGTVTDRQSRLSLDKRWGRVWTGQGSGITVTLTDVLLGVPHWQQSRFVSAEGPGIWSTTEPNDRADPKRTIIPIGTSPATTPVNSHTPKILIRPYAASPFPRFEEFSGSVLPVNSRQLVGSVGYWFGGGAPTSFDYKFQEDIATVWTDIAGTPGNVTIAAIDGMAWGTIDTRLVRSKSVRFAVRAIGASGTSAWVFSSAVTVPAKTEVVDYLAPDPAFQLKDVTYRYDPGVGGLLSFDSSFGTFPGYVIAQNTTTANRVVTIDQLPVLGDLSSVPEADILTIWSSSNEGSTTATRATLNFYATGADVASLSCYSVQYVSNSLGWRYEVYQILSGVFDTVPIYTGPYYSNDDPTFGPAFNKGRWPYIGVFTRMNFTLEGGKIRLKLKSWARREFETSYPEPVAWQENIPFPNAAIASGRIGFGMRHSGRGIKIIGMGVSLDPDIPAGIRPEIPAYTY
jgi:hypothetical protein